MPSTYAHRRFGADVLALLPDGLRATLEQHRELYDIGLHGPDLMFYYKALQSNPVNRLGNAMHEQKGEVFFTRARTVVENATDKSAALAYVLGFVCHFALDSTCHPYVEAYVRESGVGHCEIDKYANASYQAIYEPGKEERYYPDATKIDPADLPDFDLLCGGFPCQAFSNAGRRKGFEDARGTLFFEIARLAQAKRPAYLLLENVPGLLSHDKGKTFSVILSALDDLGYHVEWTVLNAQLCSAEHN